MFRICAGIILKNNECVLSYEFKRLKKLGILNWVIKRINNLNPDEIFIIDLNGTIVETLMKHPKTLEKINVPLILGGGILNMRDTHNLVPFERITVNSTLFHNNDFEIKSFVNRFGKQAVLGYLPFIFSGSEILIYNSESKVFQKVDHYFWSNLQTFCDEIILLSASQQGMSCGFDFPVLQHVPFDHRRIYISGGITEGDIKMARRKNLAGVVLDNSPLLYSQKIYNR
jgi:imidazole glycerol phosphate synthase subunit HisF